MSKSPDYKYVPMFYVINRRHYTPSSYVSPISLGASPLLSIRGFQDNRHAALMVLRSVRALGHEPYDEPCTEVFFYGEVC